MMANEARRTKNSRRNRLRAFWRKRLHPAWRNIEWLLVGGGWIIGLFLGYVGFSRASAAVGEPGSGWALFYRALQLIVLQSGDVEGPLPWQLEVARFLLPGVAAYTAVKALLAIFREEWQLFRLRFFNNHAVLCGLGERGLRLTQEFLGHGYRVAAIEADEENPYLDQCREQGAVVLVGDAKARKVLRRARVHKAKYLVTVCADDGTNAEIALHARELVRPRKSKGRVLTAFVHIVDLELCDMLSKGEFAAGGDSFRLEFFNVLERGARLMLTEHPPFKKEAATGDRQPRILIIGLGKMGRSLVVQAARNWWMEQAKSGRKLRIAVIDKAAEIKVELLRLQCPPLNQVCEFDIRQMERKAPDFERGEFLYDSQGRCDIDAIYICFDDDAHALTTALALQRKTKQHKVPIIMRMRRDAGLATLLKKDRGAFDLDQLHVFGLLDRTCSLEVLLGGRHEILARAIHEDYVRHQKEAGATPQTNPSMVDWDALPEDLKESNRRQADHIEVKLKAIGCGIEPLSDWGAPSFKFLPEEVERLAKMEHERWSEERCLQGWSYDPGPKNIKKKTSPYLVPWDELSPEIKELDRNTVWGLPSFLAQAGFQICRRT